MIPGPRNVQQLVDDIVKTVERATMSREHASDGLVSPAHDLGDLLGRRLGQRVKAELTVDVAVVYVEAERGVGTLAERHGAELRVLEVSKIVADRVLELLDRGWMTPRSMFGHARA